MSDKQDQILERLAVIETKIDGLRCKTHEEDLKLINNRIYFFSGAFSLASFILGKIF